ncbi:MAG: glycosyltransferase [Synergistaceae bacterium]|jgi:glycosyltransferase involved in cell wall biosynthesis|nr:glycosyltransferase [Synergistaceae bacterium]
MPGLLIVTTVPATIRAFLLPYADFFRQKGWTVGAMASGAASFRELAVHFDEVFDANWSRNPLDPANLRECASVREAVRRGAYDIVHVHTPVAAFVTRMALRKLRGPCGVKVVYTAHGFHFYNGGPALRNIAFRTLERLAGRWTDRLVVINREDFEAAGKYRIATDSALTYMPGIGLDFSMYSDATGRQDETDTIRGELGLSCNDVLFTMIAEFIPRKRHRDAIEALSLTKRKGIHIAFAGSGPLLEKMKDMANNLGLGHRARFLGFRNDIPALLRASRATILTSAHEGLARSLMESACLGTPIIGADARGIRDVVLPDRGLLYPTGDAFALRDALIRVAEDPLPPAKPDPEWRIENLLAKHEAMYEELLEESRSDISGKKNEANSCLSS